MAVPSIKPSNIISGTTSGYYQTGGAINTGTITISNITSSTGTVVVNEPVKKSYWMRYKHHECLYCGSVETIKERVYDEPKPKEHDKRHIRILDACEFHFT